MGGYERVEGKGTQMAKRLPMSQPGVAYAVRKGMICSPSVDLVMQKFTPNLIYPGKVRNIPKCET